MRTLTQALTLSSASTGAKGDPYGRTFLVDASTGLLLPPFPDNYTRSGPDLWCPQANGSMASFAANVIPREWANGRWGFRFDPGWSQRLLWTHDLSNAVWTKNLCSVTASKVVPNTTSGDHSINNNSTVAAVAGDVVTVTAHVKPDGYNWVRLSAGNTAGGVNFTFFDLVNGVVGTNSGNTASITKLADGSCIVSATRVASASGAISATVYVVPADNTFGWAGDGIKGVQVFSANLTNTAYPVPLTVAQGTAGTVGNHSCSALLSALGVTLGAEYTIGMDYEVLARIASQFPPVAQLRVGATGGSNITTGFFVHPNGSQYGIVRDTSDIYIQQSGGSGFVKSALRVKNSDFRAASSGVLAPVGSTGTQPSGLTAIQVARDGTGAAGALRLSKLWLAPSRALTDAELQALTAIT